MGKRVSVVTGCSTGFGRQLAERLASEGDRVYATMRGPDAKNAAAAKELTDFAAREGVDLRSLSKGDMQTFHEAFDAGADDLLDLERSLESRALAGGAARARLGASAAAGRVGFRRHRWRLHRTTRSRGRGHAGWPPASSQRGLR